MDLVIWLEYLSLMGKGSKVVYCGNGVEKKWKTALNCGIPAPELFF